LCFHLRLWTWALPCLPVCLELRSQSHELLFFAALRVSSHSYSIYAVLPLRHFCLGVGCSPGRLTSLISCLQVELVNWIEASLKRSLQGNSKQEYCRLSAWRVGKNLWQNDKHQPQPWRNTFETLSPCRGWFQHFQGMGNQKPM